MDREDVFSEWFFKDENLHQKMFIKFEVVEPFNDFFSLKFSLQNFQKHCTCRSGIRTIATCFRTINGRIRWRHFCCRKLFRLESTSQEERTFLSVCISTTISESWRFISKRFSSRISLFRKHVRMVFPSQEECGTCYCEKWTIHQRYRNFFFVCSIANNSLFFRHTTSINLNQFVKHQVV